MINSISSCGAHASDIAALRQNRAAKAPNSEGTTSASSPPHHNGHTPPGLARAAERIASKIFERADADRSGTVTQEELSTVHSRHAKTLLSGDLFGASTPASEG